MISQLGRQAPVHTDEAAQTVHFFGSLRCSAFSSSRVLKSIAFSTARTWANGSFFPSGKMRYSAFSPDFSQPISIIADRQLGTSTSSTAIFALDSRSLRYLASVGCELTFRVILLIVCSEAIDGTAR